MKRDILWIYILLLVGSGLLGFFNGKSKALLITSVVFAALLSMCAVGVVFQYYVTEILLALLLVVFGWRLAETRKFMPSGLMLILTLATLALRNIR